MKSNHFTLLAEKKRMHRLGAESHTEGLAKLPPVYAKGGFRQARSFLERESRP